MWQPGISGNRLSRDGSTVVKTYDSDLTKYYREHGLLSRLHRLPVPKVLPGSCPGELRLSFIDGVTGPEFIERESASAVLLKMGEFLRKLHAVGTEEVRDILPGTGPLIVHGDFAHYNCVMSEFGSCLLAILDWESAHLGERFEDLAWCEWQFRNRYPEHAWAISSLFEGFGEEPPWAMREQTVAARLEQLNKAASSSNADESGTGNATTQTLCLVRFQDHEEMSAFVSALSRFLNAPQGIEHRAAMSAPKLWQVTAGQAYELWLNEAAMNATASAFGHVRVCDCRHQKTYASDIHLPHYSAPRLVALCNWPAETGWHLDKHPSPPTRCRFSMRIRSY